MKGFYYSTFLLATIFITNVLTKSNPCRHVQDNVFINDPSSCDAYFKCENGKAESGKCPKDLWFDKITGQCNYKSDVECTGIEIEDPCKDQCNNIEKECFVNNPIKCSAYFYCKNGKATDGECDDGQHFDTKTSSCIYKSESECKDNDDDNEGKPKNVCKDIPNHIYVRSSTDCRIYYSCIAGKSNEFSCTENAYFNLKTATCDKKDEVKCDLDDDDIEINKPSCKEKEDGIFLKDPKSCGGWYRCEHKKPGNLGKCDKGQWFDEENQVCDWSDNISAEKCKNRCEGKLNGFALAPKTECKQYYSCKNGAINGDVGKPLSCQGELIFDSSTEHCIVKPDGFTCPDPTK